MGFARRTTVAAVAALALVLAGCGSGARDAGVSGSGAPQSTSVAPRSTDLVPSGWTLFGVPRAEQSYPEWTRFRMVADGAGLIWLLGPWQLIRLDPRTGDATTWDAADDLQFASTSMKLAPAAGPGVWLMDGARVRLFDGERFTVDLDVPADVLNVPGGPESDGWVTDVVQVGTEVWVSVVDTSDVDDGQGVCCFPHPGSGGRVARYAEGTWASMSDVQDNIGGYLAVDRDGAVWAGGVILPSSSGDLKPGDVRRWDGQAWVFAGGPAEAAPTEAGEVTADPTGGVWFVSGADGLRRFDGTTWTVPVSDFYTLMNGYWTPGGQTLAVSSDGSAWVAAGDGLARVTADGSTRIFGPNDGLEGVGGLAVGAGDSIVISHGTTVQRLEGDRFQRIWQGQPSTGWGEGYGVSAEELWVEAQNTWFRLRDGVWDELGAGSYCPSAVATDGALWTTTEDAPVDYPGGGQLARISRDGYRPVGDQPVACGYGASLSAGPDGSVWVLQDGDVVQYWPDGRHQSIGRPRSVDPPPDPDEWGSESAEKICLHGVDPAGSVWVSEWSEADDEECTAGTWHRWDGQRWSAADEPDPFTSAQEHVISGEGTGWVLRGVGGYPVTGTEIARYSNGDILPIATSPRMGSLRAVSGGRACVFEYGHRDSIDALAIVCYDPDGEIARYDVGGRVSSDSQYGVSQDGAIWLLGPQVARLAEQLPGR